MKRQVKKLNIKNLQENLTKWQKNHEDINSLRKAYQEEVLNWVVRSMEFEREPVDINRLKELLANSGNFVSTIDIRHQGSQLTYVVGRE